MKLRLDRVNRGVVLGILLGAGTAVYVIVQNIMFKSNIPEIQERAEEIGRTIAEANIGDNREGVKRMLASRIQDNFINKAYSLTVDEAENGLVMNKSALLLDLESSTADNTGTDRVNSAEYKQLKASVSKWGIDGADVRVTYTMNCDIDGVPFLQLPAYNIGTAWEVRDKSKWDCNKQITVSGSYNMIMQKEDGVWKVVKVSISDDDYPNVDIQYPDQNDGGEADGQE